MKHVYSVKHLWEGNTKAPLLHYMGMASSKFRPLSPQFTFDRRHGVTIKRDGRRDEGNISSS